MVRVKRRYIVLNIKYKGSQTQEAFVKEVKDRIAQTYGDFGVACFNRGYSVKRYDPSDGFMILQVRCGVHEMVMSVIPLITSVDKVPCNVTIIHLSGTIRGCLKHIKLEYLRSLRSSIAATMSKDADRLREKANKDDLS